MARRGSAPWNRRILPSGFPDWLPSLPEAEPANYGDTKARVKEKGGESARLRLRGRAEPLWVAEFSAVFLDPQGTRRYDSPGHVHDRLREASPRPDGSRLRQPHQRLPTLQEGRPGAPNSSSTALAHAQRNHKALLGPRRRQAPAHCRTFQLDREGR